MEIPKYFYYRVRVINKGTGVEIEDASDVDVVEVVRCEDCKWFEPEDEGGDCWCYCHNDVTWRDCYCSWGERKKSIVLMEKGREDVQKSD